MTLDGNYFITSTPCCPRDVREHRAAGIGKVTPHICAFRCNPPGIAVIPHHRVRQVDTTPSGGYPSVVVFTPQRAPHRVFSGHGIMRS